MMNVSGAVRGEHPPLLLQEWEIQPCWEVVVILITCARSPGILLLGNWTVVTQVTWHVCRCLWLQVAQGLRWVDREQVRAVGMWQRMCCGKWSGRDPRTVSFTQIRNTVPWSSWCFAKMNGRLSAVLVSEGCWEISQMGWLQATAIYSLSRFWRPEVWNQSVGGVGSSWKLWARICSLPLSWLPGAAGLLLSLGL